jgi:cell division septation protein DedD
VVLARKKKRKGTSRFSVLFTLLRYVLIAVVAILLGYGAGQLAIKVIAARLGSPPAVQSQSDTGAKSTGQPAASSVTTNSSGAGSESDNKAGGSASTGSTASTGSSSQSAGSAVAKPVSPTLSPTPTPTTKPPTQTASSPEVVPAVAPPKSATEVVQPDTATSSATGELWRVRLGRFETREAAEAALEQVRETIPQAYVILADQYQIQAGAFSERSRAVAFLNELAHLNLSAQIVSSTP